MKNWRTNKFDYTRYNVIVNHNIRNKFKIHRLTILMLFAWYLCIIFVSTFIKLNHFIWNHHKKIVGNEASNRNILVYTRYITYIAIHKITLLFYILFFIFYESGFFCLLRDSKTNKDLSKIF